MAVLGAIGDEWPAAIAGVVKQVRLDMLGNLQSRLQIAVTEGELPATTDIDRLSRFYLSVFQGMALQARDGASAAELKGVRSLRCWPGRVGVRDSLRHSQKQIATLAHTIER